MKLEQGQPVEALAHPAGAAQGSRLAHGGAAARAARAAGARAATPRSRRSSTSWSSARSTGRRKAISCAPRRTRRSSPRAPTMRRGLRGYWGSCPTPSSGCRGSRAPPRGASWRMGADREAAEILARSLERQWDSDLVALYAQCRLGRRDAAARAGRALARRAQPGRDAAPRAGRALRAGAAVGQGADLPRGEPRARRRVSHPRRARRAARAAGPRPRGQRPPRRGARSSRWPSSSRAGSSRRAA